MTMTRSGKRHHAVRAYRIWICCGVGIRRHISRSSRRPHILAPPVNVPRIDKPVVVVTGEVTGSEAWVNTNYYVLRGAVFVRDAATLNIQAGTRIIGESGSVGTLIVERGGRLMRHRHTRGAGRLHQRPGARARAAVATGAG